MSFECDKRSERFFKHKDHYFRLGFEMVNRTESGKTAPIMVNKPNMTGLFLNIADTSYLEANKIFLEILEPNLKFIDNPDKSYFHFDLKDADKYFFDFLEKHIVSIVFACISVESFVNSIIPNKYVGTKTKNIRGAQLQETFGKEWIEATARLLNKITNIIPKIYDFKFDKKDIQHWDDFETLIKKRDEIVHLKSEKLVVNYIQNSNEKNFMSTQIDFLTTLIYDGINKHEIESAREVIKYLSKKSNYPPVVPLEFDDKPPDFEILKSFLEK